MDKTTKRVVVKVGTSTLTHKTGKLNLLRAEQIARCLADLKNRGYDVVLVSSGAQGVGLGKLSLSEKPASMRGKQAVAAIGQCELMSIYDKLFAEYGQNVAQILLTKDVIDSNERKQNVINTFEQLFVYGVIPIVNENDTVSVEEIEFGDNDTLSAVVAKLVGADLLVILTDIDGLFDKDPHRYPDAELIAEVEEITDEIKALAGGVGSRLGTGGMITKLMAAEIATGAGCDVIVANGNNPRVLYRIVEGEAIGTMFRKKESDRREISYE